ncbi:hypothetical protein QBC47DRAFT_351969 [Echria macrotheca]|uniref:Ankyrin repeat protein n=1 Tax=Echria macrotheca TaxID=438768 RepID=A0AAJ0F7G4_9PEZI|nr:hypothetical protein QBC47DRAFT_351969 [Echria macrotheca]
MNGHCGSRSPGRPADDNTRSAVADLAGEPVAGVPTCLSVNSHGPALVRDFLQHYLGCIQIKDRDGFLDRKRNKAFWDEQAEIELSKLMADNGITSKDEVSPEMRQKAEEQVESSIKSLAVSIEAQYKRTQVLRKALSRGSADNLVACVDKSRGKWKASPEYTAGLEKVRRWKGCASVAPAGHHESDLEYGRRHVQDIVKGFRGDNAIEEKIADYDLERDVNAYLIQYTRKPDAVDQANHLEAQHLPLRPIDEELDDDRFKGKFPDQRVSVSLLLETARSRDPHNERNILSKAVCDKKDPTRLRYIHIPSNNMEWIETAIAGYYNDGIPPLSPNHIQSPVKTKTRMLLRPEFWRGQQHGLRSGIVHARYMRPLCERVSTEVHTMEDSPSNIVMFMPYMHWETDRMRNTVSKMIEEESEKHRKTQLKLASDAKKGRIRERKDLGGNGKQLKHLEENPDDPSNMAIIRNAMSKSSRPMPIRTLSGSVRYVVRRKKNGICVAENGRLEVEPPLGQYLIDAARLYEGMSTFRDQQMLERYLYNDPPLHPRRTLDQSHYWTLKTTKARDRDQVVYRGTNINLEFAHRLEEVPLAPPQGSTTMKVVQDAMKELLEGVRSPVAGDATPDPLATHPNKQCQIHKEEKGSSTWGLNRKQKCKKCLLSWQWRGHSPDTDENGCDHCTSEIKKVSKLIMVDQLWMWILDEQTIITSFPRRYGYNKYDLHGIHRSIRNRLRNARKNQIRSVYDLALIILDECSNTFFDRTKTHDSQPQVTDIFSEAIGNVTNKHTISFQHVWHWTQKASGIYRSKSKHMETSDLHVPLLDIHPEGKLQREVKDILDELDIMLSITRRQRELIRRFCKHVENILDPKGRWRNGSDGAPRARQDDGDESDSQDDETAPQAEVDQNGSGAESQETTESPEKSGKTKRDQKKKAKKRDQKKRAKKRDQTRKKKQLDWFHMQSQDLLCEVSDRIDELEGLRDGARSTAQSVNDLLQLKQQQASVVQAWESVNQAAEAVRQGRAIMIFTIVTIVFLPLSFMSSVFGMNNSNFGSNQWSVEQQLQLMFPVSAGIIVISVVFAFYDFLRAIIWSAYTYIVTWIAVRTGIYSVWLEHSENWKSLSLKQKAEKEVLKLKDEVRKARRKRKAQQMAKKRAEEEEGEDPSAATAPVAAKEKRWWWPWPWSTKDVDEETGKRSPPQGQALRVSTGDGARTRDHSQGQNGMAAGPTGGMGRGTGSAR